MHFFDIFGRKKADILFKSEFYNTMIREEDAPKRVPAEYVRYTVKKGDVVGNAIKIGKVTEKRIGFSTFGTFSSSGPEAVGKNFSVRRGSSISLSDIGICDASFVIKVAYPKE